MEITINKNVTVQKVDFYMREFNNIFGQTIKITRPEKIWNTDYICFDVKQVCFCPALLNVFSSIIGKLNFIVKYLKKKVL